LSLNSRAYPNPSENLEEAVPDGVSVKRCFALDSAKHLSIKGRYLGVFALPDRWITWLPAAVYSGLRLIKKHKPKIIWSTYPIATSHLIALSLHKLTSIPWVADLRDPMVYENWPPNGPVRKMNQRIESWVFNNCSAVVVTTESTRLLYEDRYPGFPSDRLYVIPNGYDESDFLDLGTTKSNSQAPSHPYRFVHSGLMEPEDRNPTPFFKALSELKQEGVINASNVKILLRATFQDALYRPLIKEMDLDDLIELAPHLPYKEALHEMFDSDALLLFQGPNCNRQIPAKLYEYFRIGKPVFAITDLHGDTARVLKEVGVEPVTPYDSVSTIKRRFVELLQQMDAGKCSGVPPETAENYSREHGARELARIIEGLLEE
jgi:glycosyltransferase involved in cell wall biosynthesis